VAAFLSHLSAIQHRSRLIKRALRGILERRIRRPLAAMADRRGYLPQSMKQPETIDRLLHDLWWK